MWRPSTVREDRSGAVPAKKEVQEARISYTIFVLSPVDVAQMVEHWIVAPVAAGSNPVVHPISDTMNVYKLNRLTEKQRRRLMARSNRDISEFMEVARRIVEDVRKNGDRAVLKYSRKLDKVPLKADRLRVREEEFRRAKKRLSPTVRRAIEKSARNIRKFHEKQMPEEMWFTQISKGVSAGEKVRPIVDVALYVPRGKGAFPSVMLMLGIPASVAGVKRVVAVTPPDSTGSVDDASLVAADLCGIREIYKVGGAQAVAAVAFGTRTIPKMNKIIGPGNPYVTAAKRILNGMIDIGLPAGPSESIILADGSANPKVVALDLMIEAEHGSDSAALLVTHDAVLAGKVKEWVSRLLGKISPKRREFCEKVFSGYGGIVLTESLEESVEFVNDYAPEHMEVLTENPFDTLQRIDNAGEILLGEWTPISMCNFSLGPNAILPTGQNAKTYSSVSVLDFLKRSSIGYVNKEGFKRLKQTVVDFATFEGFDAHAMALKERDL